MVTKQNITDKLYKAGLINNTDLQTSVALTELMAPIFLNNYSNTGDIATDISNGTLTPDTYVYYQPNPGFNLVDTAQRIVDNY